ncbi:MAG TPA: phosphopentomutase [Treponemataceae bacterium]|jgi:phosphopentomutase|nr:phosphopentomutase [Treponemataceae bacterium]
MRKINRVFIIVLDSAGAGFLPDAADYGDLGANTLGHIGEAVGLTVPNMEALGLGNILPIRGVAPIQNPRGAWGKAASKSKGKDTTIGHWEIAGLVKESPLPTWPDGIPRDVVEAFEARIGRKTLANSVASGTEIIAQYGDEHVRTGFPICYTSADSVFQIAAHESVVPLDTLYEWCKIAREMLDVGRVIARPFIGESGAYQRTPNRHDYSLEPPGTTILDRLAAAGKPVIGVGKISDIFAARGISQSYPIKNNRDGMERTIALAEQEGSGLVFTNLVDFDMKYGHRRDVTGYRDALEEFDSMLPDLLGKLREDELLIITADHGCDPVFRGTDHTREYIPILAAGPAIQPCALGVRSTFADIASTVAEALLGTTDEGSFAGQILQGGA